jgi:2-polyprenyl-3-methyl-5-hydroxy-6-metoxy-1,4-benzoquinol methylase
MKSFNYSGTELDVFSLAVNWKDYWASNVKKFLGNNVLEVGAGIGSNTKALSGNKECKWIALEPDSGFYCRMQDEQARGNLPGYISIQNGTIEKVSRKKLFDTILYIDVLEHIEDDILELSTAQSLLKVGGRIVIVAPAHNFLFTSFDKKIGHYRRYDKKMLSNVVPDNCSIEQLRYLDSVGLLASLANKLILNSDSPTEKQVLFWDRFLVKSSISLDRLIRFSFGKSIVCIIKKDF